MARPQSTPRARRTWTREWEISRLSFRTGRADVCQSLICASVPYPSAARRTPKDLLISGQMGLGRELPALCNARASSSSGRGRQSASPPEKKARPRYGGWAGIRRRRTTPNLPRRSERPGVWDRTTTRRVQLRRRGEVDPPCRLLQAHAGNARAALLGTRSTPASVAHVASRRTPTAWRRRPGHEDSLVCFFATLSLRLRGARRTSAIPLWITERVRFLPVFAGRSSAEASRGRACPRGHWRPTR